MALLTSYVLPVLAALLFLVTLVFLGQAWSTRSHSGRAAYGYGQQEARASVVLTFWKAGGTLLLTIIVLAAWGILAAVADDEPAAEILPTATAPAQPTAQPTEATLPTVAVVADATPTSPVPTPTDAPPPTPTLTPSATPLPTGRVNSPNGLYLRDVPGGDAELELIPDGTLLTLLGEQETTNDLDWVLVLTPVGNTGWVALDYLVLTNP
ncbi:MAG: SH3 domain-containing protein [Anaerolineales bacterium]|nr:SH3 domain-containing protein [Anaerolineales bacterium]